MNPKPKPKKKKKEKHAKPKHSSDDDDVPHGPEPRPNAEVGQWATADLGDNNRQQKFFALLGGFKKGGDTSSAQNSSASNVKPFAAKFNAALDKKKESELNSKLERQFEQARFTTLNARGLGLGFAEPKKNAIDVYSSRSKKFDD